LDILVYNNLVLLDILVYNNLVLLDILKKFIAFSNPQISASINPTLIILAYSSSPISFLSSILIWNGFEK
jgi:hypothetical protein